MIKAPDRNAGPSEPLCYEESSEPALGIVFEKRDGPRRFAPYAFLSAMDYNGKDELRFHFSIGAIVVRGNRLEPLWRAACKGDLARVWEGEKPCSPEASWVREVSFTNAELTPEVPAFPSVAMHPISG